MVFPPPRYKTWRGLNIHRLRDQPGWIGRFSKHGGTSIRRSRRIVRKSAVSILTITREQKDYSEPETMVGCSRHACRFSVLRSSLSFFNNSLRDSTLYSTF